ncbi:cytochrome P450 [Serendipita vermifera]|nr:cytochrome P450 [Serendipita vermifera]
MQEFVSELRDNLVSRTLESPVHTCAVSFTVVSLGYLAIKGIRTIFFKASNSHSYPPGPPQEFLIGALRSFPTGRFLERFCEWGAAYGDIVYAPIPGMKFLIINSHEVAQELLNKRPNSTSGRRFGYLVSQGVGFGWNPLFIPPGDHLFHQRKMLRRAIGPHRVGTHDQIIEFEIGKLMTVLETFQGDPDHTIQYCIGRMVSKATYGTRIWEELGEDLAHWNLEAMDILNETMFGFWPVDMFQFLRFVPDWVPGLRYKQLMRKGNALSKKIRNIAYNRGVELYKSGVLGHGILNDLLEEFGESEDLQDVTGILYLASSDTTTGGVIQFLHTLFLFPAIAERVFEEIRSITHGHRLPQVSDRPKLPYTEAAWKEALRLRPFFPIGMPHVNLQDEIIRGYFIPKGTMIQPNNLMILNDPRVWGDPEVFRPERFLEPDADQRPNPITVLFGWGMRVCPGMYLADRIIFHLVATIISLYKVEPLEGHKIPDRKSVEYAPKAVQQPIGFKCRFIVRDEKARHLLKTVSLNE